MNQREAKQESATLTQMALDSDISAHFHGQPL